MSQALEDFVKEEVAALGFDLVEFRRTGTARVPLLDIRIDRTDGQKVTIDNCAQVSRAIEPKLDASGLVAKDYVLEVSSPGVERPLRNTADWRRFAGRRAKVRSTLLGGRVEVEVLGAEESEGVEVAVLRDQNGEERRVPLSEILEARLVFRWKQ
ncbi:MAG: ribosome maturation factor RimP [Gemmatimonadaceae bacterium]